MHGFSDFLSDALVDGNTDYVYSSGIEAQALLTEFNLRISDVVAQHGVDATGKAIWYLYGCGSNTTHDALNPTADAGLTQFYHSIHHLYDRGFAAYCEDCAGHSDRNSNSFATACYMLWDMDSGLEYLTLRGRPELFPFAEQLIDFGLGHSHAACQESLLHCVGHLQHERKAFVTDKIAAFLRRKGLKRGIRNYAKQCRNGMIQ